MDCAECGFSYQLVQPDAVPGRLRALRSGYSEELSSAGTVVQRERMIVAQVEDVPAVARMHRDERVSLARYSAHAVPVVLDQLGMAAELCAVTFEALGAAGRARRLVYPWPEATERDLGWVGRHAVHEGEHHLMDVRRVLAMA